MSLTGKAKLAGIIGWPVTHSLSPVLHGHWLAAYGIDGAMIPLAAKTEDFSAIIDGVRRAVSAGGAASEETLRMARDTVADAIERVRRQSFELRPPLLEAQGLKAAVRDLAEESALEAGFLVDVDADVGRLPFGVEDLAYRTIKEAMANARKHAAARHVRVALRRREDMLEGEVEDDGRGFDVGRALDRRTMRLHMGLDSMRERLHLTGGELVIESTPGQGSRIRFRIPIVG